VKAVNAENIVLQGNTNRFGLMDFGIAHQQFEPAYRGLSAGALE
jgi:hypothetical protein